VIVVYCEVEVFASTDYSSRGVLPNVARRCVSSRNLKKEKAMAHVGPQRHKKKNYVTN